MCSQEASNMWNAEHVISGRSLCFCSLCAFELLLWKKQTRHSLGILKFRSSIKVTKMNKIRHCSMSSWRNLTNEIKLWLPESDRLDECSCFAYISTWTMNASLHEIWRQVRCWAFQVDSCRQDDLQSTVCLCLWSTVSFISFNF